MHNCTIMAVMTQPAVAMGSTVHHHDNNLHDRATTGSPKDRSRIDNWDCCPDGYTYPSDGEIMAIVDAATQQVISDLKRPLRREGSGSATVTVWRPEMQTTSRDPFVLTQVHRRKVTKAIPMHAVTVCL